MINIFNFRDLLIPKNRYRRKLFFSFSVIVLVFFVLIAILQHIREKNFKIEKLEYVLDTYADQINNQITENQELDSEKLKKVSDFRKVIPLRDLRITIILSNGNVIYDSFIPDVHEIGNHSNRHEVLEAEKNGNGRYIRISETTGKQYYYYAKKYKSWFVRTALPYNQEVINFLHPDNLFMYFLVGLFLVTLLMVINITDRLGKSISHLRNFAMRAARNESIDKNTPFPKNELGDIGEKIIEIYNKLHQTTKELLFEKEKLIKHLMVSQEGIGLFSSERKILLSNNLFIDNIRFLTDDNDFAENRIFQIDELKEVDEYLKKSVNLSQKQTASQDSLSTLKLTISKKNKIFLVYVVVFHDSTFEISVNDITETENARIIKQEMTMNIAHELKTPVAAIYGFLETILESPDMDSDTLYNYIQRSYNQVNRLALLIEDIAVLTKIEEAKDLFTLEPINIQNIVDDIFMDFTYKIEENQNTFQLENISNKLTIQGNRFLIDSIFRNLLDNCIKYAGQGVRIKLRKYFEDETYVYFSFSDNGIGMPEEHLPRIFERFYRIDKARSKKLGGTGLGLSIVKNAVFFHGGRISVKNAENGGTEFNFSLKKITEEGNMA
jgi:two-component system, OmpR family, phosphate regulon sensor histidine kinase PhoR